jgi:DNA-directed RNA polymerase specialized sigma24 family protein
MIYPELNRTRKGNGTLRPAGILRLSGKLEAVTMLVVNADATAEGGSGPKQKQFATTRWSLVLSCANSGSSSGEANEALAELCRIYWRPIFAFICHRGHSVPDAQDLTQDFFVMILEGSLIQRADPSRGRFRSLLLKSLQHFLSDAAEKRHAQKRGGDVQFVSWDDWMAEAPSRLSIAGHSLERWSAEKIFDVRWGATVVEHALHRLAEECESRGRRRVFEVLSGSLTADRTDVSYANLSTALGVPEASVKRLVHQLRRRYRSLLREEVAETVETPADVDDEIRYLCAALAASQEQTAP